jgi:hypothetical protein
MVRRTRLEVGTVYPGQLGASLKIIALPGTSYGGRLKGKLEVERTFPPGGGRSPQHFHEGFGETYRIVSGIADARKRDEKYRLKAGDTFKASAYVYHVNPYNGDSAPLTLRQIMEPATEAALAYITTLAHALLESRDRKGDLHPLAALQVFDCLDGGTWLRRVPVWSQRHALLPVGARVARRRGYLVWADRPD